MIKKVFYTALILCFAFYGLFGQQNRDVILEFERAGAEFGVPADILKALSFAETRWDHLQFADGDTVAGNGMPRQYGIMALRDDAWFGRSLREAARLIGSDVATLKIDRFQNIRGAAAYLRSLYDQLPKSPGLSFYDPLNWQQAVAAYCGIPQPELALQHSLEVLERLEKGYHDFGIEIQERPINLKPLREQVTAAANEFRTKNRAKAPMPAMTPPDYPPARWIPSADGHWYTTGYGKYFVVIHDMEGYYLGVISYFQQSTTSASVHYCTNGLQDSPSDRPAGDITQMVEEQYWAWHAICWNKYSLGIEHEGFVSNPAWFTVEQYLASVGLVKHMCDKFGIPKDRNHIIAHGEKSNPAWVNWVQTNPDPTIRQMDPLCNSHTDPGVNWDWAFYMQMLTDDPTAPKVVSTPPAGEVKVYESISVTFNQRMERASTETNFKVTPTLAGAYSWSTDFRTLSFKPTNGFDFATSYTLKIDTGAHNYMNIKLDQNGDGTLDVYSFTFATLPKDSTPPIVTRSYPRPGIVDVSTSAYMLVEFSKPLDVSTLSGGFELRDSNDVVVPTTGLTSSVNGDICTVTFKPVQALTPSCRYKLIVKQTIKDFASNALAKQEEIIFTTVPSMQPTGTIVEGVNTVGSWWQPSASGSTTGVLASFAVATDLKFSGTGSGKITYSFTGASGGRVREHNSAKPTAEGGQYYGIWVYGDATGNLLEYMFYYNTTQWIIISVDTINWTGWKFKYVPMNLVPGTGRQLAGFMITQAPGAVRSGVIYFDDLTVVTSLDVKEDSRDRSVPQNFSLAQNYPNPFNPATTIEFGLPERSMVRLEIIDVLGRSIAVLASGEYTAGMQRTSWTAHVASGIYFYRLEAAALSNPGHRFVETKKMLLVR
jgi:hypothetical protein